MLHDVYLRLLGVADQIHPLLKLALIVAEGTGRRISAWCNLRWDDVDFQNGTIRWRAETDKTGFEQIVPMTDPVKDGILSSRRAQGAIGNTPVFRAPKDPTKACSRHLFDTWLRKAYEITELPPERWVMWHSIRRKWATERKGYPVRDVMEAGGWKNEETLLRSYQQPPGRDGSRGLEERGDAVAFVPAARRRDGAAGGVAPDAADCEHSRGCHMLAIAAVVGGIVSIVAALVPAGIVDGHFSLRDMLTEVKALGQEEIKV